MSTATMNVTVAAAKRASRGSIFSRLTASISGYAAYRRTVTELDALSDRQLADIGVSRGDIQEIAAKVSGIR